MSPPPPLEHDYASLGMAADDLKGTELRLGLPGSRSPERKQRPLLMLGVGTVCHGLGAKRGFSDAIDASGKWVLLPGKGPDVDSGKGGVLFSPRGENAKKVEHEGSNNKGADVAGERAIAPSAKAQVVGWPPIRSYRRNSMATNPLKTNGVGDMHGSGSLFVKVSMDGAPYLRKVDLRMYCNYKELSLALEKMFSCFSIGHCSPHGLTSKDGFSENRLAENYVSEHVMTYQDKDGDWMLAGDVPWDMFIETCQKLRIMKGSEATGLGELCSSSVK